MVLHSDCPDLFTPPPLSHHPPSPSLSQAPTVVAAEIGPLQGGGNSVWPGSVTLLSAPQLNQGTCVHTGREGSGAGPALGPGSLYRGVISGDCSEFISWIKGFVALQDGCWTSDLCEKEEPQWTQMLLWNMSTQTWNLCQPQLKKSKWLLQVLSTAL